MFDLISRRQKKHLLDHENTPEEKNLQLDHFWDIFKRSLSIQGILRLSEIFCLSWFSSVWEEDVNAALWIWLAFICGVL